MRATWTDSRLDDFATNTDRRFEEVDRRFDEVDRRFDQVDQRFNSLEQRMEAGFERVDHEFREVRGEIGALKRIIIQIGWGLFGTVAVGMLGLISTQF